MQTDGMKGGERDGELSDDVVGVASARLLAAGVAAPRRRQALRLLGVLESVAGPDQVVRRPVRDVAVEFGLPPHEVETWLDDLELVGVVERWGDHVELVAVEPAAPGALRLHDFLALADEPADVVPLRRMARPAAGVLAAAALLIVAILAGTTLPRDDEGSPVAATGVGATSATSATSATAQTTTTQGSAESPALGTSTTTGATPATAGAAPTTTAPTAPPACPSGSPIVDLLETMPQGGSGLLLTGVIRNPSGVDAAVRSVVVHGIRLPVSVVVPADGSAPWTTTLTGLGLPDTLSAGLGDWDWIPPLPEGCPSP